MKTKQSEREHLRLCGKIEMSCCFYWLNIRGPHPLDASEERTAFVLASASTTALEREEGFIFGRDEPEMQNVQRFENCQWWIERERSRFDAPQDRAMGNAEFVGGSHLWYFLCGNNIYAHACRSVAARLVSCPRFAEFSTSLNFAKFGENSFADNSFAENMCQSRFCYWIPVRRVSIRKARGHTHFYTVATSHLTYLYLRSHPRTSYCAALFRKSDLSRSWIMKTTSIERKTQGYCSNGISICYCLDFSLSALICVSTAASTHI